MQRTYFCLVTVLALFLCHEGHAEIYSWTDDQGNRHFSNISSGNGEIEEMLTESINDEPFDPSMNAVPEEEIQASMERWKAEAEERKKRLEQESIAEEKRRIEAERKAREEKLEQEVEDLKQRLRYERDLSRRLRHKLRKKNTMQRPRFEVIRLLPEE